MFPIVELQTSRLYDAPLGMKFLTLALQSFYKWS